MPDKKGWLAPDMYPRPTCGYCSVLPCDRVIIYPIFLFICNKCFMEYQVKVEEMEYQSFEAYERSLQ